MTFGDSRRSSLGGRNRRWPAQGRRAGGVACSTAHLQSAIRRTCTATPGLSASRHVACGRCSSSCSCWWQLDDATGVVEEIPGRLLVADTSGMTTSMDPSPLPFEPTWIDFNGDWLIIGHADTDGTARSLLVDAIGHKDTRELEGRASFWIVSENAGSLAASVTLTSGEIHDRRTAGSPHSRGGGHDGSC